MKKNNAISLMIVDDHKIVRDGICAYLETVPEIEVIAQAESGSDAVQLAEQLAPDVVLMDLIMPGMDGVEATWRVRQVSPRSKIVILTSFHEDSNIFPAIKAGALSYVLKSIDPEELAETIKSAARGEAVLDSKVASRLMHEYRDDANESMQAYMQLTNREQEVLELIAKGLSNAQIAEQLVISEKTVKSHVSNILSKLHFADRTQVAVFAWKEGIVKKERGEE
ncbi:response regulator [Pelolinea submarina]|uniref:LuxR family two component transcriptional regulator n=1 Tax=Pelolinea submarina TaxID=913107 RepID=A0A347ZNL3_9CHLR|nr:response regulator transcription factor [Pelolinea submarina]REG08497.1 LuxR family two component transcriptional regulator [Pelolinea submarina]BBB46894.1 two-component system, NarL family, response regulator LiaR [Pelolinea submarina]